MNPEECNDNVTILDVLEAEYQRKKAYLQHCNNKTTTTTNNNNNNNSHVTKSLQGLNWELLFNILTSKLTYRLYKGKASRETALLLGLLTSRGALTYRSHGLFDDKQVEGIFGDDRQTLWNVMRKLERLGIVTKSLQKPWRGGREFNLYKLPCASESDVRSAIEEHNHSLETKHWPAVPTPRVPDETLLIEASLPEQTEAEIHQHLLERIEYYESRDYLSEKDQQVLERLKKQIHDPEASPPASDEAGVDR